MQACIKLFADDAKIFGRVNSIEQAVIVQISLNNAVDWGEIWKMDYHFKKCKHLHVGNHDINYEYQMETNQDPITVEKVIVEKDLGVFIDTSLKFNITKTRLSKYIENFTTKNGKISR